MEAEVPHRGSCLTAGVGLGDPVFYVSAGDQTGNLYPQRDRERECPPVKIIKTRGHFPTDGAASKMILLAFATSPLAGDGGARMKGAMNQFAILYAERFTLEA